MIFLEVNNNSIFYSILPPIRQHWTKIHWMYSRVTSISIIISTLCSLTDNTRMNSKISTWNKLQWMLGTYFLAHDAWQMLASTLHASWVTQQNVCWKSKSIWFACMLEQRFECSISTDAQFIYLLVLFKNLTQLN